VAASPRAAAVAETAEAAGPRRASAIVVARLDTPRGTALARRPRRAGTTRVLPQLLPLLLLLPLLPNLPVCRAESQRPAPPTNATASCPGLLQTHLPIASAGNRTGLLIGGCHAPLGGSERGSSLGPGAPADGGTRSLCGDRSGSRTDGVASAGATRAPAGWSSVLLRSDMGPAGGRPVVYQCGRSSTY
jgi:hypothetical protein